MSHNASAFALLSVRTLTMHTPFVAPRLAPLPNCTVSTPTVCPLCDTHFTAPTQRPTNTSAHLSSGTKRHRTARICIGGASKGRTAALAAFDDAISAMSRAATHMTEYVKPALRAVHAAAAAAAELTVDSLLSSLRSTRFRRANELRLARRLQTICPTTLKAYIIGTSFSS
eukprot:5421397-Pleurochrysis_carterae.AAC.2